VIVDHNGSVECPPFSAKACAMYHSRYKGMQMIHSTAINTVNPFAETLTRLCVGGWGVSCVQ